VNVYAGVMGKSCLVTVTFSLVPLLTTLNVLPVNFSSNVNWHPCTASNDECNAKCLRARSSGHAIPLHSDHMPQGNQKNIFPWRGGKIGGWAVIVRYNELTKHDNVSFITVAMVDMLQEFQPFWMCHSNLSF